MLKRVNDNDDVKYQNNDLDSGSHYRTYENSDNNMRAVYDHDDYLVCLEQHFGILMSIDDHDEDMAIIYAIRDEPYKWGFPERRIPDDMGVRLHVRGKYGAELLITVPAETIRLRTGAEGYAAYGALDDIIAKDVPAIRAAIWNIIEDRLKASND